MLRIHNIGGLSPDSIRALCRFLDESPANARVANNNKRQYIFPTEADGMPLIAKMYFHRKWRHRLASFLNHANADRYSAISRHLATHGLVVPAPMLIVKRGGGLFPDRTLLVMQRLEGEMIVDSLEKIEREPARIAILAAGIAAIFSRLGQAGVIHRDLSTKNILLTDDNRLALIDFDFARRHRAPGTRFQRKHQRDIRTFLSTCGRSPALAAAVASRVMTHDDPAGHPHES